MRLTTAPGQLATLNKFTTLALSIHAIRFPHDARRQPADFLDCGMFVFQHLEAEPSDAHLTLRGPGPSDDIVS